VSFHFSFTTIMIVTSCSGSGKTSIVMALLGVFG
jgi:guanylate kinase